VPVGRLAQRYVLLEPRLHFADGRPLETHAPPHIEM
jgi:hypothetical protein